MNTPRSTPNPSGRRQPIDPLLQQRLEQLGARPGQQLPPPAPGSARSSVRSAASRTTSGRPAVEGLAPTDAAARIAALAARNAGNGNGNGGRHSAPIGKGGRRAKPARAAKVASLALSAITTLGLAGLFAQQNGSTDSVVLTQGTTGEPLITAATTATTTATTESTAATATDATTGTAATTATTATEATTAATAAPATVAATTGQVLDGTYVGAADSNRWGTVQVQVVYSGGVITDVQILSYPDGDRKSVSINQRALPTLISEAISAQGADVNTVSGATYTTDSYRVSLQSAIDAALAASGISG